jgi:hypothetical protein
MRNDEECDEERETDIVTDKEKTVTIREVETEALVVQVVISKGSQTQEEKTRTTRHEILSFSKERPQVYYSIFC